jgi:hypothetical protein
MRISAASLQRGCWPAHQRSQVQAVSSKLIIVTVTFTTLTLVGSQWTDRSASRIQC